MRRNLAFLVVGVLAASLSGCQLAEALLLDDVGSRPTEGVCATYQLVATDEQDVTPEILEQTRSIIEDRVNATGVAESIVVTQGEDHISVQFPGFEDEAEDGIRSLIGATGVLEFIPVPTVCAPEVFQETQMPECLAEVEPLFNGTEIAAARFGQDQQTGEIVVNLELKDTGSRLFDEHASEHLYEQFAIVLDGVVESAPSINATHFGGQAQISGNFTLDEANNLVTVLRFGSLPLEIREVGFGVCEVPGPAPEARVPDLEPDAVTGAAATPRSVSQDAHYGGRVEVPDSGVALTLPDDWFGGPILDPLDQAGGAPVEVRFGTEVRVALIARTPTPAHRDSVTRVRAGCTLYTSPFSESSPAVSLEAWATGESATWAQDDAGERPSVTYVDLPVGRAARIDRDADHGARWTSTARYLIQGDDSRHWLECSGDERPDDSWLSIAETFEFLPAEE